jgi:hypothetical protein
VTFLGSLAISTRISGIPYCLSAQMDEFQAFVGWTRSFEFGRPPLSGDRDPGRVQAIIAALRKLRSSHRDIRESQRVSLQNSR